MSVGALPGNVPPPGFTPPEGAVPIASIGVPVGVPAELGGVAAVVSLLLFVVFAYLCFRVARKAGYNGFLGLLAGVPIVNVAVLVWFALAEWPIERLVREQKARILAPSEDE